jgi:hypothetical protein
MEELRSNKKEERKKVRQAKGPEIQPDSKTGEKLTPEKRLELLLDEETFETRVMDLLSEKEREIIEELENKLGWKKLPYKNLRSFIDWLNHPTDVSEESKVINYLIKNAIYKELQKIAPESGYLKDLVYPKGLPEPTEEELKKYNIK